VLALALGVPTASAECKTTPASAFDINGDGYADLVAGSPFRWVDGHEYAGSLHVVYGSPTGLRSAHSQHLTQQSAGIQGRAQDWAFLGQSITSGDFDGDGYADLATRAANDVLIVYGSRRGLTARDQLIEPRKIGPGHFELNGPPLATADFDRDGFSDLVVANAGNETEYGGVGIYRGSRTGLSKRATVILHRDTPGVPGKRFFDDFFGVSIAVGDVTGDGHPDLAINSNEETGGNSVFLFSGSRTGIATREMTVLRAESLAGRPYSDSFGQDSQLAIADFNADGNGDLAVGNPDLCRREPEQDLCGAVLTYAGSAEGFDPRSVRFWDQDSVGVPDRSEPGDGFGGRLGVGDLDRDGDADLAIGAPTESLGPNREVGAVTVLYGTRQGLSATGAQLWSQASPKIKGVPHDEEMFGQGPIRVLDFGKSRHADLAVHNPGDLRVEREDVMEPSGSINVLYGSATGVTRTDQLWHPNTPCLASRTERGGGFGGDCC
jgi:hypothetical protein